MFGRKKPTVSTERIAAVSKPRQSVRPRQHRAKRAASWAECQLIWPPNGGVFGVVMDISETGARVRFKYRQATPPIVTLVCPKLKLRRAVEVVRQDGTDVGLRFI
ncbi:MAG: PilZ domain-containing protein [Pseudomonadota bacterium]